MFTTHASRSPLIPPLSTAILCKCGLSSMQQVQTCRSCILEASAHKLFVMLVMQNFAKGKTTQNPSEIYEQT